ncbi:MAG: hypothetical protein HDR29_00245 [Lachnospiraceae bacterium]|nr:hypothetical protein [Lachnospiraceae bacterium]
MGKKDIVDRPFFSDCERFAELINCSIYGGEKILSSKDLILLQRKYPSLSGVSGENERDILMKDRKHNICYGIEIETESDYSMPERVMVYDICEYEYQIKVLHKEHIDRKDYKNYKEKKSRMKESDILLPTVTVVLYLGEGRWEGRLKLSQMFGMSEHIKNLIGTRLHDYDFPIIEADYVNSEDYKTDLKEFFQAMQCRGDRKGLESLFRTDRFQNIRLDTARAIAVHLNVKELIHKMDKEEKSMCRAFEELMEEKRQEGKIKGRSEGKREEKLLIIKRMIKEGLDEALISKVTRCTKEEYTMAASR